MRTGESAHLAGAALAGAAAVCAAAYWRRLSLSTGCHALLCEHLHLDALPDDTIVNIIRCLESLGDQAAMACTCRRLRDFVLASPLALLEGNLERIARRRLAVRALHEVGDVLDRLDCAVIRHEVSVPDRAVRGGSPCTLVDGTMCHHGLCAKFSSAMSAGRARWRPGALALLSACGHGLTARLEEASHFEHGQKTRLVHGCVALAAIHEVTGARRAALACWLQAAAQPLACSRARLVLGLHYHRSATEACARAAATWFKLVAFPEPGDGTSGVDREDASVACTVLGAMHVDGALGPSSSAVAREWLRRGAGLGSEDAEELLNELQLKDRLGPPPY